MNLPKKILVTGGAGFLGSHLIDRLIERGDRVVCLDNLFTGSIDNIKHHHNNDNFEFIDHDIANPIDIEVDEIFNLACPASPPHYQLDPIRTMKTSVYGIINMLDLAKRNKAKIMQASTSEVYGDPKVHPQVESYWGNVNPVGIRSCYDEGKRCAETLLFDYNRMYNVDIKVARIFNTYGPRMDPKDGRVVSNFIVQALKNEPITSYGDGSQTRSFCYVDDLIEAFIKLMDTSDKFTGPVNTGNPIEFSINELAKKILDITGSNSKLVFKDLPSDDPMRRKPDISLAKDKLNWEPSIELDEGLKRTISYFKKSINQST
jgi:UDP-glucuronate decarboxylase